MGHRLFVAVEPSPEAREAIGFIAQQWRERVGDAVRWVDPAIVHLTLHFLGDVPDRIAAALPTLLREAAVGTAPATVSLGNLGAFPQPRRAAVLFISVLDSPTQVLRVLRQHCGERLSQRGVPLDRRPWQPHLTLGRFRHPSAVTTTWPQAAPVSWLVDRVVLLNSTLTPYGPKYATVASARLGPS